MFRIVIGALLATASCTQTNSLSSERSRILPGSMIDELLDQCSRETPQKGEETWQPNEKQIAQFEHALPAELKTKQSSEDWSTFPTEYVRQYVGIVRDGHRFIYGNFAPYEPLLADLEVHKVCDGGPAYFGAEFDVESGRFTHLAFNGSA